jgi:hypothetical protein
LLQQSADERAIGVAAVQIESEQFRQKPIGFATNPFLVLMPLPHFGLACLEFLEPAWAGHFESKLKELFELRVEPANLIFEA